MAVTFGISDKEKEMITKLFDNVRIYTGSDNKVGVLLKGIGGFDIPYQEHGMSPSYFSGLQYAYQFFKKQGKELDFEDLTNFDLPSQDFYYNVPNIARVGLIQILNHKKLHAVYEGLMSEAEPDWHSINEDDKELKYLFICSKLLGNKSENKLVNIKSNLEHSLWDGGFLDDFEIIFEKYLVDNWYSEPSLHKFSNDLFEAIKKGEFVTSIDRDEFNLFDGFRGNEYIRLMQRKKKYKTE